MVSIQVIVSELFPTRAMALISSALGCYHVLLDVGSNIGMHARFLFEPDKFPKSKSSVPKLNEEFGLKRDNRDFCVFSFGEFSSCSVVEDLGYIVRSCCTSC